MTRFDGEGDVGQQPQRPYQLPVGQVVSHLATFPGDPYQATPTEARQVIADVRAALTEFIGQLRWVRGPVEQPKDYLPTDAICHRGADTGQGVESWIERQCRGHARSIVHLLLYYTRA